MILFCEGPSDLRIYASMAVRQLTDSFNSSSTFDSLIRNAQQCTRYSCAHFTTTVILQPFYFYSFGCRFIQPALV